MKNVNSSTSSNNLEHSGQDHKHPYKAPTLKEYGSLAELTRTGGGTKDDNFIPTDFITSGAGG